MLIRLVSTSRAQHFSIRLADTRAIKRNSFVKTYPCFILGAVLIVYQGIECLEHRGGLACGVQKFTLKVKVFKAVRLTEQEDEEKEMT